MGTLTVVKCNCEAIIWAMGESPPEDKIAGHEPDCVSTNGVLKKIIVNGRQVVTDKTVLTYEDIVSMADTGRTALHSIAYSGPRVGDYRRCGEIHPGKLLEVEDGLIITAVVTDNA